MSCRPCGCDHDTNHLCEWHEQLREVNTERLIAEAALPPYPPEPAEVRVVDPVTGGEKGSKPQRFSLVSPEMEWALASHYGVGARKYADRNWERGYRWSLSYDALRRHLAEWMLGEDTDAETGTHHLICVIWHATALFWFQLHGKGTDDIRRPR